MLLNRPGLRLQANQAVRYLKRFYGAVWVEAEQPLCVINWVDLGRDLS